MASWILRISRLNGDLILLEAGNYVPADCRIIECYNLKIEESALTGETLPVEKNTSCILKENVSIGDTFNMAFGTTIVVSRIRKGNCN